MLDALEGFVRRSPELGRLVDVQASKVIVRHGGATLKALAADAASSWGLRPHFAVVDELSQWAETRAPRRVWEAIASAVPKTGGRLVVACTAGDPGHWAAGVREHALGDELWRVSETSGPPPWIPGRLLAEQRRRLPESPWLRLFENRWVVGEGALVTPEDLRAAVVLDGPQEPVAGMRYAIGLDLGLRRDASVAAVCHREHGVVTLDRMQVWTGSRRRPVRIEAVEEWLVRATGCYRGAEVIADPWQTAQLVERLRRRGVRVSEYVFSAQSVGRLASTLFQLRRERSLRLPDDDALIDELANVKLRETSPGVLRLDHDPDKHDDRAVALALAAHRLVERRSPTIVSLGVPSGTLAEIARRRSDARRRGRAGRLPGVPAPRPVRDPLTIGSASSGSRRTTLHATRCGRRDSDA